MARLQPRPDLGLVHLLYFRPTLSTCSALDQKLFDLATKFRGQMSLVVRHGEAQGELFGGWVSGSVPTVLFVRHGRAVAQMIGDLPLHEIETLLRSAIRSA